MHTLMLLSTHVGTARSWSWSSLAGGSPATVVPRPTGDVLGRTSDHIWQIFESLGTVVVIIPAFFSADTAQLYIR